MRHSLGHSAQRVKVPSAYLWRALESHCGARPHCRLAQWHALCRQIVVARYTAEMRVGCFRPGMPHALVVGMSKSHAPRHDPHSYVTMSFRVFGVHSEMIHRAAALKPGRSTASYMRQLVCEWAASDLGEPVPDYTALTQGPTIVAQGAEELGMTPKEFADYAVRSLAAQLLEARGKRAASEPPAARLPTVPPQSGEYRLGPMGSLGSPRVPTGTGKMRNSR